AGTHPQWARERVALDVAAHCLAADLALWSSPPALAALGAVVTLAAATPAGPAELAAAILAARTGHPSEFVRLASGRLTAQLLVGVRGRRPGERQVPPEWNDGPNPAAVVIASPLSAAFLLLPDLCALGVRALHESSGLRLLTLLKALGQGRTNGAVEDRGLR